MVSPVNIFISLKIALNELEKQSQTFLAALPLSAAPEAAFHYTSPLALALPEAPPNTGAELACLRSGLPLTCASAQGQMAQIQGEKLTGLLPTTRYAFPLFVFELTGPEGQKERVEVLIPPFQTFAEGVLERHLLEFAVTLLDLDLQPFGFRALRNDVSLVIQASPEYAGWNLQVQDVLLMPLPPQSKLCHLGLLPGLASTDSAQIAGLSPATAWGRYLLNGVELTLFQTHAPHPDLNRVREAVLAQCNAALAPTGLTAWCDTEGHLLFKARHPDQAIELQHLPDPNWPPGTQSQALDLPEGKVEGLVLPETPLESLVLGEVWINGQTFDWGVIPLYRPTQVRAELATRFEAVKAQTGLSLWLDAAGFLHVSGAEIALEPLPPTVPGKPWSPWGIEAVSLHAQTPDWESVARQSESWIQAANHCLRQIHQSPLLKPLELPLRQALLAQMPGQMGVQVSLAPETGLQLNARPQVLIDHFAVIAEALKHYLAHLPSLLQDLSQRLEALENTPAAASPESNHQPLIQSQPPFQPQVPQAPAFTPPVQTAERNRPLRHTPLLPEDEEEPPHASFDHKI